MSLRRSVDNLNSRINIGYSSGGVTRSQSDAQLLSSPSLPTLLAPDAHHILSAEAYSWKLKKAHDGTIYAVYCVHVSIKAGLKWIVERRYSQFRELRKEVEQVRPELASSLTFPKKKWIFNLSKKALQSRQLKLNSYLAGLLAASPPLLELAIFLEVEIRMSQQTRLGSNTIKRSQSFGSLTSTLSINDFNLIKVLGKGSFGKVFLVRPNRAPPNEVYAMKVLRKQDVIKRHQVEHTMTERYILVNVRHQYLLSMKHAFQTNEKLYMVTDYCCGGELFFHLKRLRRFTEGMMRFYSAQLSCALAHLHKHDIVYRDLKPENVLLDVNGHVKLTDFGLAKRFTVAEQGRGSLAASSLTFCGTPEYLSPEMILHRRNNTGYGKEVDWWSLGIVCFELITGWPPFYDSDFNKMCEKILYRPLTFPTQRYNLTRQAEDLIRSLLQRDSSKRIRYQLALEEDFAAPVDPRFCIQKHPFFENFEWEKLLRGQVEPPYVPPRPKDVSDTCNFDKDFTKLPIRDSQSSRSDSTSSLTPKEAEFFRGFSFSHETFAK